MNKSRGAVGPVDNVGRDATDGAYHCPRCDTPFTRRSNLRRHFQIHTRQTVGEICKKASAQRLQHVASSSSPVKWDSGIKSSRRPEIPLLNESPNDIQSTSTYSSRRTQSASDSFQRLGFDLLVSPHDNTNEYGRLLSSSMGQPYQQIPPPTNLVNLNPWGSPSSDMSFNMPHSKSCHRLDPHFGPTEPDYNNQWWIPSNKYMDKTEHLVNTHRGNVIGWPLQIDNVVYDSNWTYSTDAS